MKQLWNIWTKLDIIIRIVIGIVVGILLGTLVPNATGVGLFGTLFVSALKAVAPILVFFLVISAVSQHKSGTKNNMKMVILLYLMSTFLSGLAGVIASFLFPTQLTLTQSAEKITAPSGIGEVLENVLSNIVVNPITAVMEANFIGVLAWGLLIGFALQHAAPTTKVVIQNVSEAISWIVQWVVQLAPLGIMGLIFSTVSSKGFSSLGQYAHLVAVLVGVMIFATLVINAIIVVAVTRRNPYPLIFTTLVESGIPAFFTRSSAANIPVNMKLSEKLGLNPDTYAIAIPLGATLNTGGAAITLSVFSLAAANTLGISVDFLTALVLVVIAGLAAAGAAGIAGGSLLLIPMAASLFGIPADVSAQVVGIGFIISVVQDAVETALNSSSDVVFTAAADYAQNEPDVSRETMVK